MQSEIKKEIMKLCSRVNEITAMSWHFVYNNLHYYFYMPDKDMKYLRFTIPHLLNSLNYDIPTIYNAINETNREVKFIKVVILKNCSVSISYDHKLCNSDNLKQLIPHIIKALDFASHYIISKLNSAS